METKKYQEGENKKYSLWHQHSFTTTTTIAALSFKKDKF